MLGREGTVVGECMSLITTEVNAHASRVLMSFCVSSGCRRFFFIAIMDFALTVI